MITNQTTGLPVSSAIVTLTPQPGTSGGNSVVNSDTSGEYLLGQIPDGSYNLSVSLSGFHPSSLVLITISGGTIIWRDLSLQPVTVPQATVNGYIKKQDGTPLANAAVGLYLLEQDEMETLQQVTYTDERGLYLFGQAMAGTYIVKAKSEKVE